MVERTYQQTLVGVGAPDDSADDGALVQDDELLEGEEGMGTEANARRWSTMARSSRRSSGSAMRNAGARPGEVLAGKYLVDRVAGRSGPEMVLFARHLELEQRVRLRYLLPEPSLSPDAVARFQRGARKAREMRSEHAERIIDFGRLESGSPYRVSDMPSGPSLDDVLRVRGALEIGEAVDILLAICEPVAEAHASGVVHRTLCMSSVFIERRADGSQFVKVLDFGVSDPLQPDPSSGEFTNVASVMSTEGSLAYAAPEQIRNPSAVDARADVWALGVILYELLTGVRVFEAETQLTLFAMIAADQPAPINWLRPEVPAALEAMVLSCLEKEPDARPRSVVELSSGLAPFGSGNAPNLAGRVARMGMRTTRPPPFPSSVPPYSQIPPHTRAIVRTGPPPTASAPAKSAPLPGWAMMAGGALMGVSLALGTALVLRPPATVVTSPAAPAMAAVPPAAVPAATFDPGAPVTAVPPTNIPTATVPVATVPTAAPAPAPTFRQRPARRQEPKPDQEAAASERGSTPRTARTTSASESASTEGAAKPKDLFSGLD